MIGDNRLDKRFAVLASDTTVRGAINAAGDKSFLAVDFGANTDPRYQVFVAAVLKHLPETQRLKDAERGYRVTKIIPKNTKVGDANDMAIEGNDQHISLLVVDASTMPIGIFVREGAKLGEDDDGITFFSVNCPVDGLTFASIVGNNIKCVFGHVIA